MLHTIAKTLFRSATGPQRAAADKQHRLATWENRFTQGRYRPGQYGLATGGNGILGTDTLDSVFRRMHEHHPGSAFRANVTGRIQALEESYEAHLPRMGKRGARTGMLVGTLVGSAVGIVLSAASLGVGVPLIGVAVGIGGQVIGFIVGFIIEKVIQNRFAKKHPDIIAEMHQQAGVLREVILREAQEDLSYNPERDLRRLDFFSHNLSGSFGKNFLAFVSGFCGESPRNLFDFLRDSGAPRSEPVHVRKPAAKGTPPPLFTLDEKHLLTPRSGASTPRSGVRTPPSGGETPLLDLRSPRPTLKRQRPVPRRRQSTPLVSAQAPLRWPLD